MQEFKLTKKINHNQLAEELEGAGLDRGFTDRNSDNKHVIIFIDDDKKAKTILDKHIPDDELEESLKPTPITPEEYRQKAIDEIDALIVDKTFKDYLKKERGLI